MAGTYGRGGAADWRGLYGAGAGGAQDGQGAGGRIAGAVDCRRLWLADERRAILWLPVLMGAGIWLYFRLDREPDPWWCALTALPVLALAGGTARRTGLAAVALALALAAVGAGFSVALASAHLARTPLLEAPVEETVEGRVIALSKSASGAPRVLLDRVVIYGLDPAETPARVRVALLAAERDGAPAWDPNSGLCPVAAAGRAGGAGGVRLPA